MKNVTIFLCDIYGTYMKNNESVSQDKIKRLLNNLEKLRIINNSEKILFSFVSTESGNFVKKQSLILKSSNKFENIEIGMQFFENGYMINNQLFYNGEKGKISQILFYFEKLQKEYQIDKIYYADDTEFYHFMLSNLLIDSPLENKLCSIIPHNFYETNELNNIISKIINENLQRVRK